MKLRNAKVDARDHQPDYIRYDIASSTTKIMQIDHQGSGQALLHGLEHTSVALTAGTPHEQGTPRAV